MKMSVQDIKLTVEPICVKYKVKRLELFGSYACGQQQEESDIDFCVSFDDFPPAEYARYFFGLLHELEDTLPMPIDLLTATSIKKASLKKDIFQNGICIYAQ